MIEHLIVGLALTVTATSITVDGETDGQTIDSYITSYSNPGVIFADPYEEEPVFIEVEKEPEYTGPKLTKSAGRIQGPEATETYYNLPMGRCIDIMRGLGYTTEEYPYWVNENGCKMLGEYIMVGANTYVYPKGTIVNTSLGKGIVADHCVAAQSSTIYDLAVTW